MARLEWYTTGDSKSYTARTRFLKCEVVAHLYKDTDWRLQIQRYGEVWFEYSLNAKSAYDAMSMSSSIIDSYEFVEPRVVKGWTNLSTGYNLIIDIAGMLIEAQLVKEDGEHNPHYELRPVGRTKPICRRTFVDKNLTMADALKHASLDVNKYLNMFIPYEKRHDFVTA